MVSFYRKYRPKSFSDVVGQDNIVHMLKEAKEQDRIAHAYIFSGPRGTGKTSLAKIFSKEINDVIDDNNGDIWEIDAASNNGVSEIRKIIEDANYVPVSLKYKVFIIDEVHMLSKSAFNALLKTLEEPPKHVVFILATTEIHKIPLTVLSRCQRFDFSRIKNNDIQNRIKVILNNENIEYETEALEIIARLADGSMRDALSLLEKVYLNNKVITKVSVNDSLQLISQNLKYDFLRVLFNGDMKESINFFEDIYNKGLDENKFIIDLQFFIKDLILEENNEFDTSTLLRLSKELSELEYKLMFSKNSFILIQVVIMNFINSLSKVQKTNIIKETPITVNNIKDQQDNLETSKFEVLKETNNTIIDNKIKEEEISYNQDVKEEVIIQKEKEIITINEEKDTNNIIILDVLKTASVNAKKESVGIFIEIQKELENNNMYGIAKFFENIKINAASNYGYVLTMEKSNYDIYNSRVLEVEKLISDKLGKNIRLFLLESSTWHKNREMYIEKLKDYENDNLYSQAKEFFENIEVKKI